MEKLITDAELIQIHGHLQNPRDFGFSVLKSDHRLNYRCVYLWTLAGQWMRCARDISSVIYVHWGSEPRLRMDKFPEGDERPDLAGYWRNWDSTGKLRIWWKEVPGAMDMQRRYLEAFFRFHYQLPVLNTQSLSTIDIRRFEPHIQEEIENNLSRMKTEYVFGVEEMADEEMDLLC